MRARAAVVAAGDKGPGRTRLVELRSDPPLLLRPTGEGEVHLVAGAAGPLAGDDLRLDLVVEAGAHLTLRTVAASMALPGCSTVPSRLELTAAVGPGATLRWLPEPLIVTRLAHHHATASMTLDDDTATLVWREEVFLGRAGEPAGRLLSRLDVTVGATPLLRQATGIGPDHPGWDGPAVTRGRRAIGTLLLAGRRATCKGATPTADAAVLPLEGPGTLVTVLADDAVELRHSLDRLAGAGACAQP